MKPSLENTQTESLNTSPFSKVRPLTEGSFERQIKVIVKCKHSIYKKELFFHNRLKRLDNHIIPNSIKRVLELDGAIKNSDEMPIEIVNGYDGVVYLPQSEADKRRFLSILSEYGCDFNQSELYKYSPKGIHKVKDDTLRYIIDNDGENWIVVLIDPWHMFATKNYEENFTEFKNCTRFDIEQLLSKK